MAWQKLYFFVQDSRLGYQTVNQLADNQSEMRTQMYVEHGEEEPAPLDDYHRLGHHDHDRIPRGVANLITYAASLLTTEAKLMWSQPGIPSVFRVGPGDYLLPVVGLSTFWAKVSCFGSAGSTYLEPQVRPFYPTAANGYNSGLHIYTYQLVAGGFDAIDVPCSIALYGTP